MGIWAGVDIGGTKTAVVFSEAPPAVIERREFPTRPGDGPDQAIHRIIELLRRAPGINAIGVSCGGPLDRIQGVIQSPPNLPGWDGVPMKARLEAEFGCPCRVENDANAGAVAEHRYGAGQGSRNMVFLTMGTGLGAGIITEGSLYHGASDLAGEVGHLRLTRSGPVGHNKAGSAEGWASGGGMAQLARRRVLQARRAGRRTLLSACGDQLTARDVAEAAQNGDALARRVIRETGVRLGEALAILVDVLNPERIVIGGLAMRLGESILDPARRALKREALAPAAAACRVVPAALGESIGDVAALCVAQGFLG